MTQRSNKRNDSMNKVQLILERIIQKTGKARYYWMISVVLNSSTAG